MPLTLKVPVALPELSVMVCRWLLVPQPSMVNASRAQANAAKIVLRFTAKYLQKEIFRIVAASVTCDKVTKVTTL
jgi:hypothetical protein